MKIAMINPPSPFLIDDKVFPNMGFVRVATALSKLHDIIFFDMTGREIDEDDEVIGQRVMKRIAKRYDYYLFTSTTPNFPVVYKLHRALKEANPRAKTVIGGAHASAISVLRRKGVNDVNIKTLEEFTTVFEGEGEDIFNVLTPGWQKGELIRDLDTTPIPNDEFLNLLSYHYNLNGQATMNIQTQRGCPHQCVFCSGRDVEMYNRVRAHSPQRVIREMDILNRKYGYTSFQIYDDEVNIDIGRLEKLCNELTKREYQFRAFVRGDQVVKYPESASWMKNAGFVKLCAGIESGSNRILDILRKRLTYEVNLKARQQLRDIGIHYESFMILGNPSETLQDIELTKEWLLEAKPDDFDLNLLTPYPGSRIYDNATPSTDFKDYKWEWNGLYFNKRDYSKDDSYYKGIDKQSNSDVRTKTLSNQDLVNIRNDLEEEIRIKIIK